MTRSWLNAFVWQELIASNKHVVVAMHAIYHILIQKTKPQWHNFIGQYSSGCENLGTVDFCSNNLWETNKKILSCAVHHC